MLLFSKLIGDVWFLVAICPVTYKCLSKNGVDFFPEGVAEADLVLLVTTRPTTGNTLAWAVACERDQWGRAIAGIHSLTLS